MDSDAEKYGIEYRKDIIDQSFPFDLSYSQVLYVEPYWDGSINKFIDKHLGEYNDRFDRLVYLPAQASLMAPIIQYNRPGYDMEFFNSYKASANDIQKLYNLILSYIPSGKNKWSINAPVLIRFEADYHREHKIIVYPLHYENEVQFHNLLDTIIFKLNDSGIRYSTIEEWPRLESFKDKSEYADFVDRFYTIAYEIRERIEKLQLMGVSDFVIRNLIQVPEAKLSPLLITEDYRIILPAYNNMEIEIPTLSKVVYFFYLRHPAGMRFKELIDYRDELLQIYYTISNRENPDKMKQSIDELVDSTCNSINEKCSRIRSAFISQFADNIAHNYYITGSPATPKRITLERSMIIDKSTLVNERIISLK